MSHPSRFATNVPTARKSGTGDAYLDKRPLLQELQKTEGLPTANPERRMQYTSPSQLSSFNTCAKKWYGEVVLGIKWGGNAATELGTAIHAVLEEYALTGELPKAVGDEALRRALPGVKYVHPEAVANGRVLIEHEFAYTPEGFLLPLYGLVDVFGVLGDFAGKLEDWKSTSNFKWAKTQAQLRADPQNIVYSNFALSIGVAARSSKTGGLATTFTHTYLRTREAPDDERVEVEMELDELLDGLELLRHVQHNMAFLAVLPFDHIPQDLNQCAPKGGCHMRSYCQSRGVPVNGPSTLDSVHARMHGMDHTAKDRTELLLPFPLKETRTMPMPPAAGRNAEKARLAALANAAPVDPELGGESAAAPAAPSRPTPPPPPKLVKPPLPGAPGAGQPINPPDGFPMDRKDAPDSPEPLASQAGELAEAEMAKKVAEKAAAKPGLPGAAPKKAAAKKVDDTPLVLRYVGDPAAVAQELVPLASEDAELVEKHAILTDLETAVQVATAEQANLLANPPAEDADDDAVDTYTAKQGEVQTALTKGQRAAKKCRAEIGEIAIGALARASAALEEAAKKVVAAPVVKKAATAPMITGVAMEARPLGGEVPESGERLLYVGCRPRRKLVVTLDDFLRPIQEKVAADKGTAYFRLLSHDANNFIVAELHAQLKAGEITLPHSLCIPVFTAMLHGPAVEFLSAYFDDVVG